MPGAVQGVGRVESPTGFPGTRVLPSAQGSMQVLENDAAVSSRAFRLHRPTLPRAYIPISATTGAMAPILSCHPGSLNAFALKLKRESAPGPSPVLHLG